MTARPSLRPILYIFTLLIPTLLLFLAFKFSIIYIVSSTTDSSQIGTRISSAIPYILMGNHLALLTLFLLALRIENRSFAETGWRGLSARGCLWGLTLAAVLFSIQHFMTIPIFVHFNMFKKWDDFPGIPYLVSATVFAGVIEEIVFRGYGLSSLLKSKVHPALAVFLTAVMFAVFHYGQGWVGVINASILGLGLGVAFLRTRDLSITIIAHAFANLFFIASQSL